MSRLRQTNHAHQTAKLANLVIQQDFSLGRPDLGGCFVAAARPRIGPPDLDNEVRLD